MSSLTNLLNLQKAKPTKYKSRKRVGGKWVYTYYDVKGHDDGKESEVISTATTIERGVEFKTGKPVTFDYIRNIEKSPSVGAKFQQDIEPTGKYVSHFHGYQPPGWEKGSLTFKNPIVINFNSQDSGSYDEHSWKAQLIKKFGKKGKALTTHLKNLGYDGIVTIDKKSTSEIIALNIPMKKSTLTNLLTLQKASKHGKTKHYITIQVKTKHGTHPRRVLVGSDVNIAGKTKAMVSIADLLIGKYTDKSIIIKGETYKNVNILRELKSQLGTGTWLAKQKGWVFPSKHKEAVYGFLIEKLEKDVDNQIDNGTDTDKTAKQKDDVDKLKEANKPKKKEPETDDKKISEAINNTTEATRHQTANTLFGAVVLEPEVEEMAVPFQPKEIAFTFDNFRPSLDRGGVELKPGINQAFQVQDYSDVKSIDITLIDEKEVLSVDRPAYIPDIDERMFDQLRKAGYSGLQFAQLSDDRYVISNTNFKSDLNKWDYHYAYTSEQPLAEQAIAKYKDTFTIVSRDVLAATVDYYNKKRKATQNANYQTEVDDYIKRRREHYKIPDDIEITSAKTLQEAVKAISGSSIRFKFPTKARLNKKHKAGRRDRFGNEISVASRSHFELISSVTKGVSTAAVWEAYEKALTDVNLTIGDLQVQKEMTGVYAKGEETAYGESGTVDDLLGSHGVKVKRQDGSEVTLDHLSDVKEALSSVYSVFGNRSTLAQRTNLKVSHAGDVRMHASKAVGMYVPKFNTIGVTAKLGKQQFGFTLAHEFAHFMDGQLGKVSSKHHVSDDPTHVANKIAATFRDNMKESSSSQYINRTCECFARALEQHFADKTGGGDRYADVKEASHPTPEVFKEKIQPLIEQFLKENDHLLKSLQLTIVETFEKIHND